MHYRVLLSAQLFLLLALILNRAYGDDPVKQADSIEGIYSISGKEGDADYTGTAIIRKIADGYVIQTSIAFLNEDGAPANLMNAKGIAMHSGDKLCFSWRFGDIFGVTVYEIQKDGVMRGRWMAYPNGIMRHERMKRIGALPKVEGET